MSDYQSQLSALTEIRSMMERSSRFISLSGLSGVSAGICAIVGAAIVFFTFELTPFSGAPYFIASKSNPLIGLRPQPFLLLVATGVFLSALTSAMYFTWRKAQRHGYKFWDRTSARVLFHMMLPLIAGGVFCLGLLYHHQAQLVAPATLVFYGLACINASKYTLDDIRNLGIAEVILGLIGIFYPIFSLELWTIGFGIMHIIYGWLMYIKYDRQIGSA